MDAKTLKGIIANRNDDDIIYVDVFKKDGKEFGEMGIIPISSKAQIETFIVPTKKAAFEKM